MAPGDATWEKELLLQSQFPEFILENKDAFDGRGNDRIPSRIENVLVGQSNVKPTLWRVYELRKKKGEVLLSWQFVSSGGNICVWVGIGIGMHFVTIISVRWRETFSLFCSSILDPFLGFPISN